MTRQSSSREAASLRKTLFAATFPGVLARGTKEYRAGYSDSHVMPETSMTRAATGLPFDDIRNLIDGLPQADAEARADAVARTQTLAVPQSSLGRVAESPNGRRPGRPPRSPPSPVRSSPFSPPPTALPPPTRMPARPTPPISWSNSMRPVVAR